MTDEVRATLRSSTEADVIAALEHSYFEEAFHGIAPVAILELFKLIVD